MSKQTLILGNTFQMLSKIGRKRKRDIFKGMCGIKKLLKTRESFKI